MLKSTFIAFFLVVCLWACNTQTRQSENKVQADEMTLSQVWATDTTLRTPESVIYDSQNKVLYVSNINGAPDQKDGSGFISKLSLEGKILELKWVTGLSGPKGMGIYEGKLYVTDIDELVEIDIASGSITNKYEVGPNLFLNDVTVGEDGTVYFSGSQSHKIYQFRDGQVKVFMENEITGLNGLFFRPGTLFVLANGDQMFKAIDMDTKEITSLASFEGHGDGVVPVNESDYIISDWEGQIFYYRNGEMKKLLDTKSQNINAADIEYIIDENLLLVPTFFDNRVVAYKLVEGVTAKE